MNHRNGALACVILGLCALTLAVFWPVTDAGFVNLDDDEYVASNPRVAAGLTAAGVSWAFSTTMKGNWHPLTWLSLMLDAQLFGLDPARMHQVNILLHAASGVVLFLLMRGLTGALWRSALAAALFVAHPLHVESVAWVSERKDVLSTFFWLLGLGAYLHYVRRPRPLRLLPVAIPLALGLMAKPMLVTFPFTLLILDFWPLGRLRNDKGGRACLIEKIPFFALALAAAALAVFAQGRAGALATLEAFPWPVRLGNALLASGWYLRKAIWPTGLAYFYPHPGAALSWVHVAITGVLLAAGAVVAVNLRRRRPFIAAGLLWYFVTLLPVIGLLQVGMQATADRYSYVPLIGVFLIAAWGAGESALSHPALRHVFGAAALAWVAALAATAGVQAGHWRNRRSLASHAARVAPSAVAFMDLGITAQSEGASEAALGYLRRARDLEPSNALVLYNLGWVHERRQEWVAALEYYRQAALRAPRDVTNATSLGALLLNLGRYPEAVPWLEEAVRFAPEYDRAHSVLGAVLVRLGEFRQAEPHLVAAVRLNPGDSEARRLLERLGKNNEPPR